MRKGDNAVNGSTYSVCRNGTSEVRVEILPLVLGLALLDCQCHCLMPRSWHGVGRFPQVSLGAGRRLQPALCHDRQIV